MKPTFYYTFKSQIVLTNKMGRGANPWDHSDPVNPKNVTLSLLLADIYWAGVLIPETIVILFTLFSICEKARL